MFCMNKPMPWYHSVAVKSYLVAFVATHIPLLGLIAVIVAFALKFAKVIGLAVVGGLAAFRRFFRRKPAVADLPPAPIMAVEASKGEPAP